MEEKWLYYVPCVLTDGEGKVGFAARIVELDHRLDSEGSVWKLIEVLTEKLMGTQPTDVDALPVMPLGWTLIVAKQGSGAKGNGNAT